jgi:hypothetical protein
MAFVTAGRQLFDQWSIGWRPVHTLPTGQQPVCWGQHNWLAVCWPTVRLFAHRETGRRPVCARAPSSGSKSRITVSWRPFAHRSTGRQRSSPSPTGRRPVPWPSLLPAGSCLTTGQLASGPFTHCQLADSRCAWVNTTGSRSVGPLFGCLPTGQLAGGLSVPRPFHLAQSLELQSAGGRLPTGQLAGGAFPHRQLAGGRFAGG